MKRNMVKRPFKKFKEIYDEMTERLDSWEPLSREDVKLLFVCHAWVTQWSPMQDYIDIAERHGYVGEEASKLIDERLSGDILYDYQ